MDLRWVLSCRAVARVPTPPSAPQGGPWDGGAPGAGHHGHIFPSCCQCDFGGRWVKRAAVPDQFLHPPAPKRAEVSSGLGLARLCRSRFDFALRCARRWAGASPAQPQPGWDAFSQAALMAVLILNVTRSGIPFPCFNSLQIIPRTESQNY